MMVSHEDKDKVYCIEDASDVSLTVKKVKVKTYESLKAMLISAMWTGYTSEVKFTLKKVIKI
jgi:hypothetical protein